MTTPVQPAADRTADEAVAPALPTPPERPADPRWARPALIVLLAATAVLYLWGLGASGWANSFYSAAVQAGSQSWKALFFGSFDAANLITVDKPPASLWVMGLSARLFGVSSWSILVPQALMGVATVGVLYAAVRRWFGAAAGLIAGAVLALTPVAALMFRFNNPDAMLVLLHDRRGVRDGPRGRRRRPPGGCSSRPPLIGLAFLTKMLQAYLVLPGFVLMYLVAAPTSLRRRFGQLLAALGVLVVSSGWWVAVVELWPASSRPFVGGSQNNSVLDLLFGYNGFGRLTGNETGSVTGGGRQERGQHVGADRADPDVLLGVRRPGRLAAAGRADPARRAGRDQPAGAAHRPAAGLRHPVGRLAAGHRARVQPGQGDHPLLLRGGPGPGHRRARRDRRGRAVAASPAAGRAAGAGRHAGRDRLVVRRPARSLGRLAALAAPARAGGRPGRRRAAGRRHAAAPAGGRGAGRRGPDGGAGRTGRLLGPDRIDRAHRRAADGRTDGHQRLRPRHRRRAGPRRIPPGRGAAGRNPAWGRAAPARLHAAARARSPWRARARPLVREGRRAACSTPARPTPHWSRC